jgi:hypothetical protein
MSLVLALLGALRAALRTRTDLTLENLALRQQLALLRRRSKRPQFGRLDRLLWVWLSNHWAGWREALHLVRPESVIRWHRQGFRVFWAWKSRRERTGRPPIGSELADLVRTMALANPLWGAPRIHGELLKLGLDVSQRTAPTNVDGDPSSAIRRAYGLRRALALSKFTSGISRSDARDGPRGFLPVAFFIALPFVGRDASRADDSYRVFGLLDEDNVPAQEDIRSAAIWSALGQHMSSRHRIRASSDGRKQWKLLDPSPSL